MIGIMAIAITISGCGKAKEPEVVQEEVQQPETIHIYSDSEDITKILGYIWEKYPDWKARTEVIVLSKEGYAEAIEAITDDAENEKCPDIIVADCDNMSHFRDSDYTMDLGELGFNDSNYSQMFTYTKDIAVDAEGKMKGLTWEVTPGAFIYRKSFAAELLGANTAKDMQAFVKDWNTFIDTARNIDKKSSGALKMLASSHDIDKAFRGIGSADLSGDSKYNSVLVELDNNKFTSGLEAESDQYYSAADKGNVFGYFCDADTINIFERKIIGNSKGDWGICPGPSEYVTGGSWIFVNSSCKDASYAGQLIKYLCTDTELFKTLFEKEHIFVNNINTLKSENSARKGRIYFLEGSEDYIQTFIKSASDYSVEKVETSESEQE